MPSNPFRGLWCIGLLIVLGASVRADDAPDAPATPDPTVHFKVLPLRCTVPPGWNRMDSPPSPAVATVEAESIVITPPNSGLSAPHLAVTVAHYAAPVAPGPVLKRVESAMLLMTPDLFATPEIVKREETTLWGMPAVKLALRCVNKGSHRESRQVCWMMTDGRRVVLLMAESDLKTWPATWEAFVAVTRSMEWLPEK